jgi:hypothetical protein
MPYSWALALGTTPRVHNAVVAHQQLQQAKQLVKQHKGVLNTQLAALTEAERAEFDKWVQR